MRINRERFAAAMARRDMSVLELAAKAGVSRSTITSVKGGKRCSDTTGRKLAAVLGEEIIERRENT